MNTTDEDQKPQPIAWAQDSTQYYDFGGSIIALHGFCFYDTPTALLSLFPFFLSFFQQHYTFEHSVDRQEKRARPQRLAITYTRPAPGKYKEGGKRMKIRDDR